MEERGEESHKDLVWVGGWVNGCLVKQWRGRRGEKGGWVGDAEWKRGGKRATKTCLGRWVDRWVIHSSIHSITHTVQ